MSRTPDDLVGTESCKSCMFRPAGQPNDPQRSQAYPESISRMPSNDPHPKTSSLERLLTASLIAIIRRGRRKASRRTQVQRLLAVFLSEKAACFLSAANQDASENITEKTALLAPDIPIKHYDDCRRGWLTNTSITPPESVMYMMQCNSERRRTGRKGNKRQQSQRTDALEGKRCHALKFCQTYLAGTDAWCR